MESFSQSDGNKGSRSIMSRSSVGSWRCFLDHIHTAEILRWHLAQGGKLATVWTCSIADDSLSGVTPAEISRERGDIVKPIKTKCRSSLPTSFLPLWRITLRYGNSRFTNSPFHRYSAWSHYYMVCHFIQHVSTAEPKEAWRYTPWHRRPCVFCQHVSPRSTPVHLNMYQPTVYNHIDAVVMCCDWAPDPPCIVGSDKVLF